eukprot:6176846-Pleurochrysis_carterae.AAC.4
MTCVMAICLQRGASTANADASSHVNTNTRARTKILFVPSQPRHLRIRHFRTWRFVKSRVSGHEGTFSWREEVRADTAEERERHASMRMMI